MNGPALYLFDDDVARRWAPFTLTRPVGELRYGVLTSAERAARVFGIPCSGHVTRRALEGFDEPGAAPVVRPDDIPSDRTRILLSSRAVPELQALPALDAAARFTIAGTTVGWIVPEGAPLPVDGMIRSPAGAADGPAHELAGELLERPWSLVAGTPARVAKDVHALYPYDHECEGVVRIGADRLSLGDGAEVEPGVVVDTRLGPIRLDDEVRVEGPGRLVGPLYVGRGTRVLGGHVGTSSIGPVCRIRGEVADSVVLGYSNKAHDGHLGHAFLGRWVNLGAGTTNSDLKNNYGPVRVWTLEGETDTGLMKVGCFLGDHVKTGIGTLLNTGAVVGAGSNLFGGVLAPTVVPPFSWGAGADLREHRLDRFLATAEAAMARRGEHLTPGMREVLTAAWHGSRTRRAE